jgi:hypothetical protein
MSDEDDIRIAANVRQADEPGQANRGPARPLLLVRRGRGRSRISMAAQAISMACSS